MSSLNYLPRLEGGVAVAVVGGADLGTEHSNKVCRGDLLVDLAAFQPALYRVADGHAPER